MQYALPNLKITVSCLESDTWELIGVGVRVKGHGSLT